VVGLIACADSPAIPGSDPAIRGAIRGPGDLGSFLVVAGADSLSRDIHRRAQVQLGRADIVRRSGGSAPATELKVGIVVSVWSTGLTLDVCPGIVTAATIVIEDGVP
jgi:hypothetical protein